MEPSAKKGRVCVTGAGGFLASWLVELLLSKGYTVYGTVRDPSDPRNEHLKRLKNAAENLQLFKADLLDYDSIASAIAGCEGVFHSACPVPPTIVPSPEFLQADVIAPAVTGTLNVLRASLEAKVKRVVVVSSITAITMRPDRPHIMDEDSWSDEEYCRNTENWYCFSKTRAEREALDYAEKNGLDVVTVCPSLLLGPLLQPNVNSSSLFLINVLKGNRKSMENKTCSIVDVRDAADALLLVYEKPEASGRYICSPHAIKSPDLMDMVKSLYPNYNYIQSFTDVKDGYAHSVKLEKLGWKCKTLKKTLVDSVESYRAAGLLDN